MAYRRLGSRRRASSWTLLATLLAFSLILGTSRELVAEETPLPVTRQAEILVRVAAYDRNLKARAAGKVKILIVTNNKDPDSRGVGAAMQSALSRYDKIAGLPTEVTTVLFPGATQLAAMCRSGRISIVYVTPGLEAVVPDMARALNGVDVFTVSAIPRFVRKGVVFGFDLVSGRPTLLLNLAQAKRQNVAIDPNAVRLMQVIQ